MKNRLFLASVVAIALGIVFLVLENIFYQYIDKDGILHESLFLPIGALCIIIGTFGIVVFLVKKLLSNHK